MNLIQITSCEFSNIHGLNYGSAYFLGGKQKRNIIIKKSRFIKNISDKSGGAFTVLNMDLVVEDSVFSKNFAQEDGGAFYLKTPLCTTCGFSFTGNTVVEGNDAKINGGAMVWEDYKPDISDDVVFENNSAAYGGNFASKPASLMPVNSRLRMMEDSEFVINNIAPGQVVNTDIIIGIYDRYGQSINTDNQSIIRLLSYDEIVIIGGKSTFQAIKGIFQLAGFIVRGSPGSIVYMLAETDNISNDSVKNDDYEYKNSIKIKVGLRKCKSGEASETDSCIICPSEKYLIKTEKTCKSCPNGGICPGGSDIWLKPGYYRTTNKSEIVYSCPLSDSCLGNNTGYESECRTGYTGITCNVCNKGYSKSADGKCSRCPQNFANFIILFSILAGFIIISIIIVRTTIVSSFTATAKYSIYLKIFTNYLQLVFLTSEFKLSWPPYVIKLFGVQKSASNPSETIFSVDCFTGYTSDDDPEARFYYKMIFFSLLPAFIIIFSAFTWIMICFYTQQYKYLKRELLLTISVIFFLVHP